MKKILNTLALIFALTLLSAPTHAQKSALLWGTYFGDSGILADGGEAVDLQGNVYITGTAFSNSGLATAGAYQTVGNPNGNAILAKFSPSGALVWATYFGGDGASDPCVATDRAGNVYLSGRTTSTIGIATHGAYQTSYRGGADVFLAKINSSGNLIWATYYGGDKDDYGYNVVTDTSGNIFLSGQTYSTTGIATSGAYQTKGDSVNIKAFLAKFNSSGKLIWGTYYGGNKEDINFGLAVDISGNASISGYTYSTTGIASSGAYLTVGDSVNADAFLAKFNSSGNLLWGTYFGGSEGNYGYGIAADTAGNIYLTGETNSILGIATSGAYQTLGDSGGAFLAKFNPFGKLLWATYFGENDAAFSATIDSNSNIYITGSTDYTSGIATSGAYQTSCSSKYSAAFWAKFNPEGALIWGTYYGGSNGNDGGGYINVYTSHDIYIMGSASSTSSIATSGAYQTQNSGDNIFLAKFNIPTLYGDAGISSIVSPKGSFCADTIPVKVQLKNYGADTIKSVKIIGSINGTGSINYRWDGSLLSGTTTTVTINGVSFKTGIDTLKVWAEPIGFVDTFPDNDTATIIDTIKAVPDAVFSYKISNDTVKFIPYNKTYSGYIWAFGDGNTSDSISPSHPYSNNGTYTVSLTITGKNGCAATYKTTDTVNYTGLLAETPQMGNIKVTPNPFTDKTVISYSLPNSATVSAAIYDMTGRQVTALYSGRQEAGSHELIFDAEKQSPNIYMVKLLINNEMATQKIVKIN